MKIKLPHAFIGHAGVGSRIELVQKGSVWVLRETTISQLWTVAMLGLLGFYPPYLLIFQSARLKGGIFTFWLFVVVGMLGISYCVKYAARLIGHRRIEFDLPTQQIRFYPGGSKVERVIPFSEARSLKIDLWLDRSSKGMVKNHPIILVHDNGQRTWLAISDKEASSQAILALLHRVLPVHNG